MNAQNGLTCSSVNLRSEPDLQSHVAEVLGPQEQVQVLEDRGEMLKVQTTKWQPHLVGYALKSAIVHDEADREVFPKINVGKDIEIPSVPPSLSLNAFLRWLDSGDESPWLPANYLQAIQSGEQPSVGKLIRQAVADHHSEWDAWVSEIRSQGREASAALDEWLVILTGGREMWSFRTERIFTQPSQISVAAAWVTPKDILHWTGHVRVNNRETKYKTWYEVEFTKLDREFKGWYKASLLEEFVLPTAGTDMTIPENKEKVFDLSRPRLRLPADAEVEQAKQSGRAAAQYIDVREALGWGQIHHNLCGQFCVAALGASDVIPLLKQWLPVYRRAKEILEKDYGSGIPDLQSLLDVLKKRYEFFQAEASVIPATPGYLRKMLDTGRMAIVGVGITNTGLIKWNSRTRHWVVIEDIIRVGNSGWVRLYNPFHNREEVYPFGAVFDTVSGSAIGLWVELTRL